MGLYAREETNMKTVLVLFGGKSSEYEVSLLSASSVVRNIPREKYNIVTLGITRDGKWRLFEGDTDKIESDDWIPGSLKAYINIDYGSKQVIVEDGRIIDVDVCFPVLHGRNGEDGTVAALLTLAGIPFVGCDNLAGAVCMDKAVTNALADYENVPQAKWLKIDKFEYADNGSAFLNDCFEKLGCPVVSLLGWQAGFHTNRAYGSARIESIKAERLQSELDKKKIVVVAGFQGINKSDDLTTLGRGGSDTSAVAIAAVLHADRCQIFTDVTGVFTADPRKIPNARKLKDITYDEML